MSAAIATGVMPFGSALSDMVLYTMSQAWQLGRAVQRAVKTHGNVVKAIAQQQGGLVLISGKVRDGIQLEGLWIAGQVNGPITTKSSNLIWCEYSGSETDAE